MAPVTQYHSNPHKKMLGRGPAYGAFGRAATRSPPLPRMRKTRFWIGLSNPVGWKHAQPSTVLGLAGVAATCANWDRGRLVHSKIRSLHPWMVHLETTTKEILG